nr:hypothetical protein [Tanacetum cinerariifolium]
DKIIYDLDKTPDLSQRSPQNCPKVTHEAYQCQPMNEDYYHEQNSCYDPNSFGFDQFQPQQYTVNHPIFSVQNDLFNSQNMLMEQLTSTCDMIPACYDDDDDDYTIAITLKEPDNSLSMGHEHLDTIPAMESNEFIKSSVENLVPNPSKSEGEYECDVPACEVFTTFYNILFDADYDFYSSDDQSYSDEDIPKKNLCLIVILRSYPLLRRSILFSMSSPDIDSLMEKIDLSFTLDDPMPSGIEEDDYDSERDTLILKELLSNDSLSLPKNESFHFDIPSSSRPPAKPPDGNTGILNVKVMGDIFEQKVPMPRLMFTQSTLVPNQEKYPDLLSHLGHEAFQPSAECPMMIYGRNAAILNVPFFHFYLLDQFKYGGIGSSLATLNKRFVGGTPCLSNE